MKRILSRKFIVTLIAMGVTASLAYIGKMDNNVAMVMVACITAYNWANAQVHKANTSGKE